MDQLEKNLWEALVCEGKFDLIEKLRHAEKGEAGYGTIVVTKKGFSKNNNTHNMVIKWLKKNNIHFLDIIYEIGNLELALHNETK